MMNGASAGRPSLSQRISGQYTLYLVRSMVVMLAVFTIVYWFAVIVHASGVCGRALNEVSEGQWQRGGYLVDEAGLSRLSGETGRPGVAEEYEARAQSILENVQRLCWVEREGLYCEAPGFMEFSQHVQVLAVLTGMVEGDAARALLERMLVREDIVECSLPWRYYLFRALERYGLYDQMRRWLDSFSALRQFGFTTMPEWGFEGSRSD